MPDRKPSREDTPGDRPQPYTGPPMDLANMRENGVAWVSVSCACGHEASVDVSALSARLYVPALADRLRCSSCGARPTSVRPDWSKRVAPETDPTRYLRDRIPPA